MSFFFAAPFFRIEHRKLEDEEYAISDAVTSLGKLLRYSMKWVSGNVLVEQELEYIKNYMALINLRFDYEIYLSLNIPELILKQEIPKMSLQPIVENAICHGIEQMAEDTNIYIKGLVEGDDCVIEITDAGKGMTEDEVKHGRIAEKEFEVCMQEFLEEIEKVYRKVIESESGLLNECKNIMKENCIDDYEEKVMELVLSIHEKVNHQFDQNKNQAKMRQAVEYIKENYAKDLNMAVVSNDLSMNYSLFSYSFKEYTGCNFVSYLKEIRMKEAKRLLADTDLKIIEISQKVGYDNEKHFMKMFKATCGVSPTEYRNNIRLSG